jgi:hypothetical protein
MRVGTAPWLCVGWLLVGSFAGCARTQPQDDVSADAGLDAVGDGGGEEAVPLDPNAKVLCPPDPATCTAGVAALSVAFETPASVELLQARGVRFLGRDSAFGAFVVYATGMQVSGELPTIAESFRLPARYTRATLGSEGVLACDDAGCAVITRERSLPVPVPLSPSAISGPCVGGNGIACFDPSGAFSTLIAPAGAPVAAFALLSDRQALVSSADGELRLLDSAGARAPFELARTEPLTSLESVAGYPMTRVWAARTQSGFIVVGDARGGGRCDLKADDVKLAEFSSLQLTFLNGDRLVSAPLQAHYAKDGCQAVPVPPGTRGHTYIRCGVTGGPVVFDAHRIYAPPIMCAAG